MEECFYIELLCMHDDSDIVACDVKHQLTQLNVYSQSEWMKRDESNKVYWFETRLLSLVYL